jgi:hypothetical protein
MYSRATRKTRTPEEASTKKGGGLVAVVPLVLNITLPFIHHPYFSVLKYKMCPGADETKSHLMGPEEVEYLHECMACTRNSRFSNCTTRKHCDLGDLKNVPIIRLGRITKGPERGKAEARKIVSVQTGSSSRVAFLGVFGCTLTGILRVRSSTHWHIYQATSTYPICYVVGCTAGTRRCRPGCTSPGQSTWRCWCRSSS